MVSMTSLIEQPLPFPLRLHLLLFGMPAMSAGGQGVNTLYVDLSEKIATNTVGEDIIIADEINSLKIVLSELQVAVRPGRRPIMCIYVYSLCLDFFLKCISSSFNRACASALFFPPFSNRTPWIRFWPSALSSRLKSKRSKPRSICYRYARQTELSFWLSLPVSQSVEWSEHPFVLSSPRSIDRCTWTRPTLSSINASSIARLQ